MSIAALEFRSPARSRQRRHGAASRPAGDGAFRRRGGVQAFVRPAVQRRDAISRPVTPRPVVTPDAGQPRGVRPVSGAAAPTLLPAYDGPTPTRTARATTTGEVRLTRRGRLVVFLGALALVLAAFVMVGNPAASTTEVSRLPGVTVAVAPGDTLWSIAEEVAPRQDPRTVVDDLIALNALSSASDLQAGQSLVVPDYR